MLSIFFIFGIKSKRFQKFVHIVYPDNLSSNLKKWGKFQKSLTWWTLLWFKRSWELGIQCRTHSPCSSSSSFSVNLTFRVKGREKNKSWSARGSAERIQPWVVLKELKTCRGLKEAKWKLLWHKLAYEMDQRFFLTLHWFS